MLKCQGLSRISHVDLNDKNIYTNFQLFLETNISPSQFKLSVPNIIDYQCRSDY